MHLKLVSFGFKYGVPPEASVVLDCRVLRNPVHDTDLKGKTGCDQEVIDRVRNHELWPLLVKVAVETINHREGVENKKEFTYGIGCVGGRHRSVALVNVLSEMYSRHMPVSVHHRDMDKEEGI
jgi:UPF0042 nucleotide-binding protein